MMQETAGSWVISGFAFYPVGVVPPEMDEDEDEDEDDE